MNKQLNTILIIVLIVLILTFHAFSYAAVIHVPRNYFQIQEALNAAKNGDTIQVEAGLYKENLTWPKKTGIKLIGSKQETIIDGRHQSHVISFYMNDPDLIDHHTQISHFKIQNGKAPQINPYGGGIYVKNASPTVSHVLIMDNQAERGGGIYFQNAHSHVMHSIITANHCVSGGGIYCQNSTPLISQTIITKNKAAQGSGVTFYHANAVINQSSIMDNMPLIHDTMSSSIFGYHALITIQQSIIWNTKSTQEIYLSEFSEPNQLTIGHSNIRNAQHGVFSHNKIKINWLEGNISKHPKPFGLYLKKIESDCTIENLTHYKRITINGQGGFPNTIDLFVDGKKIPDIKRTISNDSFSMQVDLTDGTHTITAHYSDQLSGTGLESDPLIIIVDTIPPKLVGLQDDTTPKTSKTWQWKAIDVDTAIQYRYHIDQKSNTEPTGSYTTINSITIAPPQFHDGTWYLHIQAIDTALNQSPVKTVKAILDSQKPVIVGLETNLTPVRTIQWSWSTQEKSSDMRYRYWIDQQLDSSPMNEFINISKVEWDNHDGLWYLHVQAKDLAGNISDIVTVSAITDKTPPVIKGLSHQLTPTKSQTWKWHAVDTDTHIVFQHTIDQNPESSPHGEFTTINQAMISQLEGKWFLHVQAKDRAGNMSECVTVSAIMDNTPPQIRGLTSDNTPVKQKKWSWQVNDADDTRLCRYLIDQDPESNPDTDFQPIYQTQINEKEGIWYLHVQAIDRAGNMSQVVTVSTLLDNSPPVIIGIGNHQVPVKGMTWNWTIQDTDPQVESRYRLNQSLVYQFDQNDTFQNTNTVKISDKNGTFYIHVQAKDSAGNLSEIVTSEVVLDNTAPIITGLTDDLTFVKEKTWTWESKDNDPYVVFRYMVDELSIALPVGAYTHTQSVYLSQLNGTFFIHVQAKDRAGNESQVIHAKTIMDNSPPIITGLMDDHNICQSKTWQWDAQDNDPQITYRFSINTEENAYPGGPFQAITQASLSHQDGIYFLHVQAIDRAGNISPVVTVSTILDNTQPIIQGLTYDHDPKQSIDWHWQVIDDDPNTKSRFQVNQHPKPNDLSAFQELTHVSLSGKNGRWMIHVQAKDSAGNLSDITTGSALLDNSPPKIIGILDDPTPVTQKVWVWHAQDTDPMIQYRFIINQNPTIHISGVFQNISKAKLNDVNGIWYIHVQATDRSGNLSDIMTVSSLLDNEHPVINGLLDDPHPNQKKTWSWYASDNDASVLFRYAIDQHPQAVPSGLFDSTTRATLDHNDGKWFIHVQAKDRAGNMSDVKTVSAIIDNTPPEIIGLSDDFIPQKMKIWTWYANDQDPQVLYRLSVDSTPHKSLMGAFTNDTTASISGGDGIRYLHIQAKDSAGNLSDPVFVKAVLDNTAPVIKGLENDPLPKKNIIWHWHASDQDSQIVYRYTIDEYAQSLPTGVYTHSTQAHIQDVNGKWYLHIQAKDRAGNESKVTTVYGVIDAIAPVIIGLQNDINPTKIKHWTWSAEDQDQHVRFRYIITANDNSQMNHSYSHVTQAICEHENGKRFIHVQAIDRAGNESEVVTVSAILDSTPPIIQGLSDDHVPMKSKRWQWQVIDQDPNVTFRYTVDQNQTPIFTTPFTKERAVSMLDKNGKWYLHVQAKDTAGNYSEIVSVSTQFDNEPPVIYGLQDDTFPQQKKVWQWSAHDNDPTIRYRYTIDQMAHTKPFGQFETQNTAELNNSEGLWYIHVQGIDRAGNMSKVGTASTYLDHTPPEILNLTNDDIPKQSKTWRWQIKDIDSEIVCRYAIDQHPKSQSMGSFQKQTTASISGLDGQYYLHVQAKDRANNVSEIITVYAIIDQTPPVITGLMDDHLPKQIKKWLWQAIDNDPNILYRYGIDQKAQSNPVGSFTHVTHAVLSNTNGLWYLHVQAKDRAGLVSPVKTVSAVLDNKKPLINGLTDDLTPHQSKTWTWSSEDDDSTICYRYIISTNKDAMLDSEFTTIQSATINQGDGVYYLKVQGRDSAGNISQIVTVSTIIDQTPPIIQGLSNDDMPIKKKVWKWQALDADSEIEYQYHIDQQPQSKMSGHYSKKNTADIDQKNGKWYLHVQAKDRAGNISEQVDVYTILDNEPPIIIGLDDDIIPRKKKQWKWHAQDKDNEVVFRHTINQMKDCVLNRPFSLKHSSDMIHTEGKWFLHVQAKDRAGNISPMQSVYAIINSNSVGLPIFLDIHFESNKSYTEIRFINAIKKIAMILDRYSDTIAVIEAHSDNTGDDDANQTLSEKRANHVRHVLINNYHIKSERIQAIGYGSTKPIADNSTPEGRRKNRRANAFIYHIE